MRMHAWMATAATISALLTVSVSVTATAAEGDAATLPTAAAETAVEGSRGIERATSDWSLVHGTASASGRIRPVEGKSAIDGDSADDWQFPRAYHKAGDELRFRLSAGLPRIRWHVSRQGLPRQRCSLR
jgi:hypothetical protein